MSKQYVKQVHTHVTFQRALSVPFTTFRRTDAALAASDVRLWAQTMRAALPTIDASA